MPEFGWVIDMDGNLYLVSGCEFKGYFLTIIHAYSGSKDTIASLDKVEGRRAYTKDELNAKRNQIVKFLLGHREPKDVCDLRVK